MLINICCFWLFLFCCLIMPVHIRYGYNKGVDNSLKMSKKAYKRHFSHAFQSTILQTFFELTKFFDENGKKKSEKNVWYVNVEPGRLVRGCPSSPRAKFVCVQAVSIQPQHLSQSFECRRGIDGS